MERLFKILGLIYPEEDLRSIYRGLRSNKRDARASSLELLENLVEPPRLITGHDIMREVGVGPGPEVGRLLRAVEDAQGSGDIRTREDALALVRRQASEGDKRARTQAGPQAAPDAGG